MTSREKAVFIVKAARGKKAEGILVLDMRKVCNFTDYFVIASGSSDRKVRAIADGIEELLKKKRIAMAHKEGYNEAKWIVLDFTDVIAHIFYNQTRELYLLERLWADAPVVKVK